jgi:DNA-binding NarL/FixJ family response regulator
MLPEPVSISAISRLNERQKDVLLFLCKGLRNSEIAAQLRLSPRTVKWYVSQLLLIYDASNRTELAGMASREVIRLSGAPRPKD